MSLHDPKFILALSKTKSPAPRPVYLFCGIPIVLQFSRRPRVLRLEVNKSRPKGYGSPLSPEGA